MTGLQLYIDKYLSPVLVTLGFLSSLWEEMGTLGL